MHLPPRAAPQALALLIGLSISRPAFADADLGRDTRDSAIRLARAGGAWLARTAKGAFVCWAPPPKTGRSTCFKRVSDGGMADFGPSSPAWHWQAQASGALVVRSGDAIAWLPAGSHTLAPVPDSSLAPRLLATQNWHALEPAARVCTNDPPGVPVASGDAWSFALRPCTRGPWSASRAALDPCESVGHRRLNSRPGAGVRLDLSAEGFVSRAFERRRVPWITSTQDQHRHRPEAGLTLGLRVRFDPRLRALSRRDDQQSRARQASPRPWTSRATPAPARAKHDAFTARETEALQRARCDGGRK